MQHVLGQEDNISQFSIQTNEWNLRPTRSITPHDRGEPVVLCMFKELPFKLGPRSYRSQKIVWAHNIHAFHTDSLADLQPRANRVTIGTRRYNSRPVSDRVGTLLKNRRGTFPSGEAEKVIREALAKVYLLFKCWRRSTRDGTSSLYFPHTRQKRVKTCLNES